VSTRASRGRSATQVTFGLFACIEEGRHHRHGLVRVSPKGLLTKLT
jgi:hypothetical protein